MLRLLDICVANDMSSINLDYRKIYQIVISDAIEYSHKHTYSNAIKTAWNTLSLDFWGTPARSDSYDPIPEFADMAEPLSISDFILIDNISAERCWKRMNYRLYAGELIVFTTWATRDEQIFYGVMIQTGEFINVPRCVCLTSDGELVCWGDTYSACTEHSPAQVLQDFTEFFEFLDSGYVFPNDFFTDEQRQYFKSIGFYD